MNRFSFFCVFCLIVLAALNPAVVAQEAAQGGAKETLSIALPHMVPNARPMEFLRIPAGEFTMGSPDSDADGREEEKPPHLVSIGKDFYLGKYEISQAQWQAVMENNPSYNSGDANAPVENVSWNDCQAFIAKLNQLGQGTFRLPSEAEWEYACRAGSKTRFFWGDEPMSAAAESSGGAAVETSAAPNHTVWVSDTRNSYADLSNRVDVDDPSDKELVVRWRFTQTALKDVHIYMRVDGATKPVYLGRTADGGATSFGWRAGAPNMNDAFKNGPENGHTYQFMTFELSQNPSLAPYGPYLSAGPVAYKIQTFLPPATNAFGLYGMSGGVWEWCQDAFDSGYYARSPKADPLNDRPSRFRVCRGSSQHNSSVFQRAAARGKGEPDAGYYYIGFRIVREN